MVTIQAPEVARWREDTPGCAHHIHLNNAGAGLMPWSVLVAITDKVPILPQDFQGWREYAEYAVSIAFGFFTGTDSGDFPVTNGSSASRTSRATASV